MFREVKIENAVIKYNNKFEIVYINDKKVNKLDKKIIYKWQNKLFDYLLEIYADNQHLYLVLLAKRYLYNRSVSKLVEDLIYCGWNPDENQSTKIYKRKNK